MDPHIRAYRDDEYEAEEAFGREFGRDFAVDGRSFAMDGQFVSMDGRDFAMEMKVSRLYQRLEERGEFAELDKAKRNEHYRAYLLTNFEEDDGFGY